MKNKFIGPWDWLSWSEYGVNNTEVVVWSSYWPLTLELWWSLWFLSTQNICDYLWYDSLRQTCIVFKKKLFGSFPCSVKQGGTTQSVAEIVVSCSLASSFPEWHSPGRNSIYREPSGPWPVGLPRNLSCLNSEQPTEIKPWFDLAVPWKLSWRDGMMWEVSESCLKADMLNLLCLCSSSRLQSPCSRCKPICWLQAPGQLQLPCRAAALLLFSSKIFPQNPTCSLTVIISEELGSNKEVETLTSCSAPAPTSQHLQKDIGK